MSLRESYKVNSLGVMERVESSTYEESKEENDIKHIYFEKELHNLLRRNRSP